MNPDPCHPTSDPGGCSSVGRAPALQAGGRRFDSVHLHQLGHPVMPTPFRFSRWGIWFGAPRPEATRVSKRARGRGCDEGRPTLPGFFIKAKSSARLLRCLSLWIGLFDEGFDLRPVAVDVRFCRASGVGGSCHGSRRVLMNMSVYSRAGFVPARDGSCDQAS